MKTFSITDTGKKRETNQDFVYTSEKPVGLLPSLFIVADGMGGHKAGDYASRYAVEIITEEASKSTLPEPAAVLRAAIHTANHRLVEKSLEDHSLQGMGTTAVAAVLKGNHLWIANVGDSRLYLINGSIRQITKDHSLVEEMVRLGELEKEAAKNHPDKHIITRAIGATDDVNVDIFEVDLSEEDLILMCTDGLTNMIEDEDIRTIVKSQRDIAEKAERLVQTANDNGGSDNITVIVIEPFSGEVKSC